MSSNYHEYATDGTRRTGSPLDEHAFCPKCGMCIECEDCAIWGCGKLEDQDDAERERDST